MPINNVHARYPHYARQQQQSIIDPLSIPSVSGIQNTGAVASANPSVTATGLLLSPSSPPGSDSPVDGNGLPLVPGQSAITVTTTPSSVLSSPSSSPSAASNSNLNANSSGDGSNGLSIGAVVGICVGVFLGLCILLIFVLLCMRRRNKKAQSATGGARGSRGRDGVDGSGGAGVKGGFSPLPDDIAGAGALSEKRIDKPTRPSRPTSPISPNSVLSPSSAAGHGRSTLKPIPTLSPLQVSSISSVPPSYSYHITNSTSPVPSVSTDTGTSISIYSPSASMITGGNNTFSTPLPAYESGNSKGFAGGNGIGSEIRTANVNTNGNGYAIAKPPPVHTNTDRIINTNVSSPTSSLATHATHATNTSPKSHKMNYGGSLGLAHAFHDRTSLYTTHSSNGDHSYDADADGDGSFLTMRNSDYDLSNKMKMTPEAKATPPISVLSDVEEREVGTPPVTPSYSVLVSNGGAGVVRSDGDTYFSTKNSVNPFEDPSTNLPPLSYSPSMDLPRSPPPAITLTIPPTPNTASSAAPSYTSTSTTATMKNSHNRMESLLAALNIPLSPAGVEDENGGPRN